MKIVENEEKWLINNSKEPDMINATLDIGRSLRQIIIGVSLFLAFQAIRKSANRVQDCNYMFFIQNEIGQSL